jgi:hypothetical protein
MYFGVCIDTIGIDTSTRSHSSAKFTGHVPQGLELQRNGSDVPWP